MDIREFILRECDFSIGDTIYYVVGEDALYSIKKTRIIGSETRHSGFRFGNIPCFDYLVYRTEDGHLISRTGFCRKRDEMDPSYVFTTKNEAVQCIIECLHKEINRAKHAILCAQARLEEAERVLKVYQKYGE